MTQAERRHKRLLQEGKHIQQQSRRKNWAVNQTLEMEIVLQLMCGAFYLWAFISANQYSLICLFA